MFTMIIFKIFMIHLPVLTCSKYVDMYFHLRVFLKIRPTEFVEKFMFG